MHCKYQLIARLPLFNLLLHDCRLLIRKRLTFTAPFLFLLAVIAFIPMIFETNIQQTQTGFLLLFSLFVTNWVASDFTADDGTLQFYKKTDKSISMFFISKYLFCWLITGLPIVVISSFLDITIVGRFAIATLINAMISLLVMLCAGAIKKNQMLLCLLALPFYLPVLVFANHNTYLLAAMLLFMLPVGIFLGTYTLKGD
jgi:heme exporter protein B